MSESPSPSGERSPNHLHVLVDIATDDAAASLSSLDRLRDIVTSSELEVLFLGPPLRIQIPLAEVVGLLDLVPNEQVRIVQWPFTQALPPN